MTVLSAVQGACRVIGLTPPDVLIGSTDRKYLELAAVAQEVAERIASGHDWQLLRKIKTITGDGLTEDFDLPTDYGRMLVNSSLWSDRINGRFSHIADVDRWLGLDIQNTDMVLNAWTIYGGQLHIKPAPETDELVKFFYVSNLIIAPSVGTAYKATFTADTDLFRLDETLLKLGIIWQWRANKGFPYAEDMTNYEELKERLIVRDKGSKIVGIGAPRLPSGVNIAYPWSLPT